MLLKGNAKLRKPRNGAKLDKVDQKQRGKGARIVVIQAIPPLVRLGTSIDIVELRQALIIL